MGTYAGDFSNEDYGEELLLRHTFRVLIINEEN